jgi:hypothetical protein
VFWGQIVVVVVVYGEGNGLGSGGFIGAGREERSRSVGSPQRSRSRSRCRCRAEGESRARGFGEKKRRGPRTRAVAWWCWWVGTFSSLSYPSPKQNDSQVWLFRIQVSLMNDLSKGGLEKGEM